MTSAKNVTVDDALVSQASFDASHWYAAQHMPATVLQILQENGVYKNLYFGMNLATPGDLWKQDWWYRTTFIAAARPRRLLPHLQRHQLSRGNLAERAQGGESRDRRRHVQRVRIERDANLSCREDPTYLAVKVTPEQRLDGVNGVELGDSWLDWINWKYLGYQDPRKSWIFRLCPTGMRAYGSGYFSAARVR